MRNFIVKHLVSHYKLMTLRDSLKTLGVKIDDTLSFRKQVTSICHSCFYYLHKIASIKCFERFKIESY